MAASQAVRQAKWLRYLFSDLGYGDLTPKQYGTLCGDDFAKRELNEKVDPTERPLMLQCDNKGAIAVSDNPVLHRRSTLWIVSQALAITPSRASPCGFQLVRRVGSRGSCFGGVLLGQ